MTIFNLCIIGLIAIILIVYLLTQYVLSEKQIFKIKYTFYAGLLVLWSIMAIPISLFRPRNVANISLVSRIIYPSLSLFGIKYRLENTKVLDKEGSCVIVANHQSSIDIIGITRLWPDHIRHCTILAKKELLYTFPLGIATWLSGLEFVDRKNREKSSETMRNLTRKIQNEALRLWIFPEGTRSMGDTLLPFKLGAFRLAIDAQVPIVPVVFSSYKPIYSSNKKSKVYYWRRGCVTIKCLEPIETKGMTIEKDLQQLTDMTRQRMIDAFQTIETVRDDKKDN